MEIFCFMAKDSSSTISLKELLEWLYNVIMKFQEILPCMDIQGVPLNRALLQKCLIMARIFLN
jgi:hypothetical protein